MLSRWYKDYKNKKRIKNDLYDLYTQISDSAEKLSEEERSQIGMIKSDVPKYEALKKLFDAARHDMVRRIFKAEKETEMKGLQWASGVPVALIYKITEYHTKYILTPPEHAKANQVNEGNENW